MELLVSLWSGLFEWKSGLTLVLFDFCNPFFGQLSSTYHFLSILSLFASSGIYFLNLPTVFGAVFNRATIEAVGTPQANAPKIIQCLHEYLLYVFKKSSSTSSSLGSSKLRVASAFLEDDLTCDFVADSLDLKDVDFDLRMVGS